MKDFMVKICPGCKKQTADEKAKTCICGETLLWKPGYEDLFGDPEWKKRRKARITKPKLAVKPKTRSKSL